MATPVTARRRAAPRGRPPHADQRAVREAVLRAALRLFGEKGYDACSLQEIAARARVTKPMVAYYYESKAGLLRAVLDSVLGGMLDRLRAVSADDTRSVRDRVEELARAHRELSEKQPAEARLLRRLLFDPPRAGLERFDRERMTRLTGEVFQCFLGMAEQAVRSGELRGEPRVIAALLHAVFAYAPVVQLLCAGKRGEPCGAWTEEMFASLWAGFEPRRRGVVR